MNPEPNNYVSRLGFHRHRCTECNTVWEHSNRKHDENLAHQCPKCKKEQFERYTGPRPPTTISE